MLLHDALTHWTKELHQSDAPALAARVLAAHVLHCTKSQLVLKGLEAIPTEAQAAISELVQRHKTGEPLAYIVGFREFYGREFKVTQHTLIPRPETEEVMDAALAAVEYSPQRRAAPLTFADLGTGTGCIAVTLAAERPAWRGVMLDLSAEALCTAQKNACAHAVQDRILPLQGDLRRIPLAPNSLDLLISNPPYVSQAEYQTLAPSVRDFEPATALVPTVLPGEQDAEGLSHLHALAAQAHDLLRANGVCVVEHGFTQGATVQRIFKASAAWRLVRTGQDLSGHDRWCVAMKA